MHISRISRRRFTGLTSALAMSAPQFVHAGSTPAASPIATGEPSFAFVRFDQVLSMPLAGGQETLLHAAPGQVRSLQWSPSGRYLRVRCNRVGAPSLTQIVDTDNGTVVDLDDDGFWAIDRDLLLNPRQNDSVWTLEEIGPDGIVIDSVQVGRVPSLFCDIDFAPSVGLSLIWLAGGGMSDGANYDSVLWSAEAKRAFIRSMCDASIEADLADQSAVASDDLVVGFDGRFELRRRGEFPATNGETVIIDADTGEERLVLPAGGGSSVVGLGPDGLVVIAQNVPDDGGVMRILLHRAGDTDGTEVATVEGTYIGLPSVTADGKKAVLGVVTVPNTEETQAMLVSERDSEAQFPDVFRAVAVDLTSGEVSDIVDAARLPRIRPGAA